MSLRPTHLLRHEHRVIEQALRALTGMCLNLASGNPVPPEALAQALDFIQIFADRFHHTREEDLLFPALEQAGFSQDEGALHFLRDEHQLERELLAELALTVAAYQTGEAGIAPRLIRAANEYSKHLLSHMQKEDSLLFHLAEELLDENAKAALLQQLAPAHTASGSSLLHRYEQLATTLENQWSV